MVHARLLRSAFERRAISLPLARRNPEGCAARSWRLLDVALGSFDRPRSTSLLKVEHPRKFHSRGCLRGETRIVLSKKRSVEAQRAVVIALVGDEVSPGIPHHEALRPSGSKLLCHRPAIVGIPLGPVVFSVVSSVRDLAEFLVLINGYYRCTKLGNYKPLRRPRESGGATLRPILSFARILHMCSTLN